LRAVLLIAERYFELSVASDIAFWGHGRLHRPESLNSPGLKGMTEAQGGLEGVTASRGLRRFPIESVDFLGARVAKQKRRVVGSQA
jgi:hypothetical protein